MLGNVSKDRVNTGRVCVLESLVTQSYEHSVVCDTLDRSASHRCFHILDELLAMLT
jgi:hypothetical protein